MARAYMEVGSAPVDESCVSVSRDADYLPAMRAECLRFIDLVRKKLGPEPPGARLAVKSNNHDFGIYQEVVCYFDDSDEEAMDYVYRCESEAPRTWQDDQPAGPISVGSEGVSSWKNQQSAIFFIILNSVKS